MTRIKRLIEQIDDEICGAKDYAESYLDFKVKNVQPWANKFKEMAQDELKHATYLHDYTVQEIEELNKIYTPTEEMREKWDKSHREYVEKVAWIKQMLAL